MKRRNNSLSPLGGRGSTTAVILLMLMTGLSACKKEKESIEIPFCELSNLNYRDIVEIENVQTKLYFLIPYPGFAPQVVIDPEGISYRKSANATILKLTNYEGRSLNCSICNLPDYVLDWNTKNEKDRIGDSMIEGKLDVAISGKVYVSAEVENIISGTLELITIKK
jgi:hypothetical protein